MDPSVETICVHLPLGNLLILLCDFKLRAFDPYNFGSARVRHDRCVFRTTPNVFAVNRGPNLNQAAPPKSFVA